MVRKWSYIINKKNNFSKIISKYQFKIFKKTVRFKKHIYGDTIFVRKKYIKRKESRNYIINIFIASGWLINYFKQKQINRFLQKNNYCNFNILTNNYHYFNKKKLILNNQKVLNITTISIKFLKYIFFNKTNVKFLNKNNFYTIFQLNENNNNKNISLIYSNTIYNTNLKIKTFNNNNLFFIRVIKLLLLIRRILTKLLINKLFLKN